MPKRTRKARPSHPRLGRCGLGVDGRAAGATLRGLSGRGCGQIKRGVVASCECSDPESQTSGGRRWALSKFFNRIGTLLTFGLCARLVLKRGNRT